MIIRKLSPRLVSRTADTITGDLNRWITWFQAHPHQEFGDHPAPVFQLEDELGVMCHTFDKIQIQFEQNPIDWEATCRYWSARDLLYQTLEYVVDVRERDYGSIEQTRHLLQLLATCRERLSHLVEIANLATQADTHYVMQP